MRWCVYDATSADLDEMAERVLTATDVDEIVPA